MAKTSTNTAYWAKRQQELEEHWQRKSKRELEAELAAYYKQSLAHIEGKIERLYQQFAVDNKIDMAEAQKLLTGDKYRVWRMDLAEYVRAVNKTGDKELLKELNTLAMRSRITRFDALRTETLKEMAKLAQKSEAATGKFLKSAYKDFYGHGLFEIGKKAGLENAVAHVDADKLEAVLRTPWSGRNYSERIWKNTAKLEKVIEREIFSAAHRGVPVADMSRIVAQKMNVGIHEATRLVRTELNYVENQAALASIKDAGLRYYEFVATLDRRTSSICRSHDGHIFSVDDANPGTNMPPLHPRCRSVIAACTKEDAKPHGTRIGRKDSGERVFVPADMKYGEFEKRYLQGEVLKPQIKASQGGGGNGIIGAERAERLEQAKNRSRKIKITDVAIDKVGRVEAAWFTEAQKQELHEAHKTVLTIARETNNSDEVVLSYNLYTGERAVVLGDTHHVDIDADSSMRVLQRKSYAKELVLVHNHPSTANFSLADIDYFIANDCIGVMSVVTNQGEVYTLLKTSQYSYDKIRDIEMALIRKHSLDNQSDIVEAFLKACNGGGVKYVKGK